MLSTINFYLSNTLSCSCSAQYSCLGATVRSETKNNDIIVICSGADSCSQMTVELQYFNAMSLFCVGGGACQQNDCHSANESDRI